MVDAIQAQLAAGNYVIALQDALGNGGASVSIFQSHGRPVVTVTGTPTGLPTVGATRQATRPNDSVVFSAAAQAAISDAGIALTLISAQKTAHTKTASTAPTGVSDVTTAPAPSQVAQTISQIAAAATAAPSSAGAQVSAETTGSQASPSIATIIADAEAAAADPSSVYDQLSAPGTLGEILTLLGPGEEASSFLSAFNSKTLDITKLSDITGYEQDSTTVITGTSQSGFGGPVTGSALAVAAAQGHSDALTGFGNVISGSFLVTWGAPPSPSEG